jgi:hypothetical protein
MWNGQPSPITPEVWQRLLRAFNAGVPPAAACRYAGITLATWEAECQRIPEFAVEAGKVEMSGLVAAWTFLQQTAASEWRAALELIKLYGSTRAREAGGLYEPGDDDPDASVSPDDIAAVIRILRAHGGGGGAGDLDAAASGAKPVRPGSANGQAGGAAGGDGG